MLFLFNNNLFILTTAEPEASFQVVCRKLQESDPDVQEIYSDDADYNEVISTKGSLLTPDPESTAPILDKSDKDIEKENNEIEQDTKGEETDIEIGKENDGTYLVLCILFILQIIGGWGGRYINLYLLFVVIWCRT